MQNVDRLPDAAKDSGDVSVASSWRKSWIVILAFLAAWLIFASTPLLSMAMLLRSARDGDVASVAKAVDVARTRRSIARQLVTEHVDTLKLSSTERQLTVGVGTASVAAWLEDVITVESISGLVSGAPLVMSRDGQTLSVPAPDIGTIDLGKAARIWWQSGFKGPVNYTLHLPGQTPADNLSLELALNDLRWQIVGVNLSSALRAQLARKVGEIAGAKVPALLR